MARLGYERSGMEWRGRFGTVGTGTDWHDVAGWAWSGQVRCGQVRQDWFGGVWHGLAQRGKACADWWVTTGRGKAGKDSNMTEKQS